MHPKLSPNYFVAVLALVLAIPPATARGGDGAPVTMPSKGRGDGVLAQPLHWAEPFKRINVRGAYVSVIQRDNQIELWNVQWDGMNPAGTIAERNPLTVVRGPDLEHLGPEIVVQQLRPLIDDVADPKNPAATGGKPSLAPGRAMTRPAVIYDSKEGYILSGCVVPEYLPGTAPLLPAIFTSPLGEPGSFKYHGILKPEPLDLSLKRGSPVWCDGGGVVRLPGGTWRLYANNYLENYLSAAEAPTLGGPWKFLRDSEGKLRNLTARYADAKHGTEFPSVLRVSEKEWHAWVSNGWPVREIHHLYSTDGLDWVPYGQQPEITPESVGGRDIKCIRAHVSADGKQIVGLLSIFEKWSDGEAQWVSHVSRMPVGPPPAK